MADINKVINGLNCCKKHGSLGGKDCSGYYEYTDNLANIIKANNYRNKCPYGNCTTGCVVTLISDTIELLNKLNEENTILKCSFRLLPEWLGERRPEVVRCNNCKYENDRIACPLNLQAGRVYKHKDHFFCADGKRIED